MKDYDILKIANRGLWFMIGLMSILLLIYGSVFIFLETADTGKNLISAFGFTGDVGNSINGVFAPIIGLFAVITTFLAFIVQFQANQDIRKDTKIERFENKFYEMLRIHIDNVNSIEIAQKHKGRKAFVRIYEELRFIYCLLVNLDKSESIINRIEDADKKLEEKRIKIAYHHMFFGVDEHSKRCNNPMSDQYSDISQILCKELVKFQKLFNKEYRLVVAYEYSFKKNKLKKTYDTEFYPFDGHVSKLGHLYRNLFHMIKFVARTDFLSWQQKFDYLKMLRGQLSNHEQAIMYFNIIWIDKETWWLDNKNDNPQSYLLDYAILKNLPFNLTDQLGPDPKSYFLKKIEEVKRFKGYSKSEKEFGEFDDDQKLQWLFEWNN